MNQYHPNNNNPLMRNKNTTVKIDNAQSHFQRRQTMVNQRMDGSRKSSANQTQRSFNKEDQTKKYTDFIKKRFGIESSNAKTHRGRQDEKLPCQFAKQSSETQVHINTLSKIIAECQTERKDNDVLYMTISGWEEKVLKKKAHTRVNSRSMNKRLDKQDSFEDEND